jgi:nucleotide-binding universal stress UspA family protein
MFTHLVVPLAGDAETARAVFPAAAIARAFDATVVVVAHPSAGIDPEDVVDRVGTAEVAAVRLDADAELGDALTRLAPAFGAPAVVCTGALALGLLDRWPGPLLVFGDGADPDSYAVGGTVLVDGALHAAADEELVELGRAVGFGFEPVDDVTTAEGAPGQIIVPRRDRPDAVATLVERWRGPVYLLGG